MDVREAFVKHRGDPRPPTRARTTVGVVSAAGTPRILVADDEAGIRDVVGRYLDAEGYDVAFARDGIEALAMARGTNPISSCST